MLLQVFSLPLKNPVLIFSLILFIILLTPVLLQRLRIPDLIGLIIAGAVIGPNGVGIMERDSSIELFGTVGLLYIMFIAGLEIDMADLKKNYGKTLTFGLYIFPGRLRSCWPVCMLPTRLLLTLLSVNTVLPRIGRLVSLSGER